MEFRGIKYSPQTGLFYRCYKNGKQVVWGKARPDRYIRGYENGKNHLVHRIAFLKMTGKPLSKNQYVDHINGKRNDNRWINLRLVDRATNYQNKIIHRRGKLLGCHFDKHANAWKANFQRGCKKKHIGSFKSEIEAHTAYMNYMDEHNIPYLSEMDKRIK